MKKLLFIPSLLFVVSIFAEDHPMLTISNETGFPLTIRNGNRADFFNFEQGEVSRFPTRGEPINVSVTPHNSGIVDIQIPYNQNNVIISLLNGQMVYQHPPDEDLVER